MYVCIKKHLTQVWTAETFGEKDLFLEYIYIAPFGQDNFLAVPVCKDGGISRWLVWTTELHSE
jgi:hypothetical protein